MASFNRGEWSEIYVVLFLLVKPRLKLVDSKLNELNDSYIYHVRKVILESEMTIEYRIMSDAILVYINETEFNRFSLQEVECYRRVLLSNIVKQSSSTGSFTISSLDNFLSRMSNGFQLKANSKSKSDITLISLDFIVNEDRRLSYSIKSSLGSPATILNASSHTDFLYEIENFEIENIEKINEINSRTKLIDRITKIQSLGGVIKFRNVSSATLDYNLRMIDTQLPEYLGNTLLHSYINNDKNLKKIFVESNNFLDENLGLKKLGDFLNGISFGFIPSCRWDGINSVTGGLLIVKSNGEVVVLDSIYNSSELNLYLINESKLDSPSSTRYNMINLFECNGRVFFTLNLQIRYKG